MNQIIGGNNSKQQSYEVTQWNVSCKRSANVSPFARLQANIYKTKNKIKNFRQEKVKKKLVNVIRSTFTGRHFLINFVREEEEHSAYMLHSDDDNALSFKKCREKKN